MNPNMTEMVNALPPQWHGTADLVLKGLALLVFFGHFLASHGGVRGVATVIMNGKPKTNS